ncbi:MAG: VWA domain-containing protein, partial [Planctomycetales bacterium]
YETLKAGESDRANLTRPRWQAGYDLAIGRSMAAVVRNEGYNAMLAEAKNGKKFDGKNNTWILNHSDEVSVSSSLEKLAKQSRVYLERVIKEHPNTPWAYLAQKELETPFGWTWDQSFTDVSPPMQNAGGNGEANNPKDKVNRIKRKPKPPLPKL